MTVECTPTKGVEASQRPPALRDPDACMPRRPPRTPRWMPSRDRRDAGTLPAPRAEGWRDPAAYASPTGGPVRIFYSYNNRVATTSAAFSRRANGMVYAVELHEKRVARDLETRAVRSFQMQPANLSWLTAHGARRGITLDVGVEELDGSIWLGEVKAHRAFFRHPAVKDILDEAEKVLAGFDIGLRRLSGEDYADRAQLARTAAVHRNRGVVFGASELAIVRGEIERRGGTAPRGALVAALPRTTAHAEATIDAMLVAAELVFPIDRPVTCDTPVVAWPTAPAGARTLRQALRELSTAGRAK